MSMLAGLDEVEEDLFHLIQHFNLGLIRNAPGSKEK
jgi:hypothetical protein